MNKKRHLPSGWILVMLAALCIGCSPNPKKKCNTCPKWTSALPCDTTSGQQTFEPSKG